MTNKEQIRLFLKNILLYSAILVGGYYLYHYNNTDTHNIPHTDFSFVYAQF